MAKKVKISRIPKNLRKIEDAERIEIGRDLNTIWGLIPRYEVRVLVGEKLKVLGGVEISYDTLGKRYTVNGYHSVSGDYPFGKTMVKIEKEGSLDEAKQVAHDIAVQIAEKIAKANNLPLEDKVLDEELAHEIDSLPFRKGRLSIFTLSIIVGLALSISSLSTTGYAVSNALGSGQGIGGILLFLIGLVGMFFSLRK